MTLLVAWAGTILGLSILVARRRTVAIVLMVIQSVLISGVAIVLAPGRSSEFVVAACVLTFKTIILAILLTLTVRSTRERSRIPTHIAPLVRLALTLAAMLPINLIIPTFGFIDPAVQQVGIAMLCAGGAIVVLRRETIFQLIGILVAENAIALAALSVPDGMPAIIELGAVFDIILVISVALVFHQRIYSLFGSGDSTLLHELHD